MLLDSLFPDYTMYPPEIIVFSKTEERVGSFRISSKDLGIAIHGSESVVIEDVNLESIFTLKRKYPILGIKQATERYKNDYNPETYRKSEKTDLWKVW